MHGTTEKPFVATLRTAIEPGEPLGLIAGQGRLPILVAQGARAQGYKVCAVGLSGQYNAELPDHCDTFKQVGLLRIGAWARALKRMGVRDAVMVGRVGKAQLMHDPLKFLRFVPDPQTLWLWYRRLRHDRRSPAVLAAVADSLEHAGVRLIDSTLPVPEHMAHEGVMTSRPPAAEQEADVAFGWSLLRESLRLHIGQAIAVRSRDVLAVEAVEGTDAMLKRAGELCKGAGWSLLKAAGETHDRRADVPTVGTPTIELAAHTGCKCIALGAGEVIIVDKPETLALADKLGIAVVGVAMAGPAGP